MMTFATISVPFVLGWVSSIHCTQMCGPIVLAYSMPARGALLPHLAYNAGRLTTYAFLGALAGIAGGGLIEVGKLAGLEQGAAIFAGIALIAFALALALRSRLPASKLVQIGGGMPVPLSRIAARLLQGSGASGKLALGLALGFLPCGLVYAALLQAVHTADPLSGAASMLAFGAGTVPALLAVGLFSTAITARFKPYANVLASCSMLLMGIALLWRGMATQVGGSAPHVHLH